MSDREHIEIRYIDTSVQEIQAYSWYRRFVISREDMKDRLLIDLWNQEQEDCLKMIDYWEWN